MFEHFFSTMGRKCPVNPRGQALPARRTALRKAAGLSALTSLAWAMAGLQPAGAWGSTLAEKVVCTDSESPAWMGEPRARALFKAADYLLVKFKVSGGRCYEFYAVDHQNNVVEAYMHPISGEVVRLTRIPPPSLSTAPQAPSATPPGASLAR